MRVIFLLSMLVSVAACSRITNVDGLGIPAPPSAPTLIELTPEVPRFGEAVTATASGSVDPGGTTVRYRFAWERGGSPVQEGADGGVQDTLISDLHKGEQWVVRVTPVSADGRVGDPAERAFTIGNTAPTLPTVALNHYRPITTDVVRATPEGHADVDGDAVSFRYVWRLGERPPIETTQAELDLSSLMPDADTEELSVDVIATDGEDDAEPLSLGPFWLNTDDTRWRPLQPTRLLDGGNQMGDFVAYDERHRRFLMFPSPTLNNTGLNFDWSYLWAYQSSGDWVLLHPDDDSPELRFVRTAYDGTPGAERLLVAGYNDSEEFEVHALALHDRGLEQWTQLAVPTGPPTRFIYTLFYDESTQVLMMHGGIVTGFAVTDELWLLDLSGEAPTWIAGSPFNTDVFSAGATSVPDPTMDNALLLFGGLNEDFDGLSEDGANGAIHRFTYDFSDVVDFLFDKLEGTLEKEPTGVIAVADPERQLVVGGLGARVHLEGSPPVDKVWTYDPSEEDLQHKITDLFLELDVEAGSLYGAAGWQDGRALFWPGRTQAFESRWRLGQVISSAPTAADPNRYEWRSLVREGIHYPNSLTQVTADQNRTFALTGAESPEAFFYERLTNQWTAISLSGESPGPIDDVVDGAAWAADGLWTLDGMTPWYASEDGWETMSMLEPLPLGGTHRSVFAPDCEPTTPLGVVGQNVSELLRCPAEASECHWESVSGIDVLGLQIHTAFDGRQYVLAVHNPQNGGPMHPDREHAYWRIDACSDAESGWQRFEVTDDPGVHPDYGSPFSDRVLGTNPPIHRMSDDEPPVFIVLRQGFGENRVWRLTETGSDAYQAHFIEAEGFGPIPDKSAVTHWNEETQSLLHFDVSRAEVWELRVRGEDLP